MPTKLFNLAHLASRFLALRPRGLAYTAIPVIALTSIFQSADAQILSNLQAHYKFDDAANLGADSSGKGNNLTTGVGTPAHSTSGKFTGALYLNGNSSLIFPTFPTGPNGIPTGNNSYSIACWIKPDLDGPGDAEILGWGDQNPSKGNFLRFLKNSDEINNYWWYSDFYGSLGSGSLFDGKYHLVVATWDQITRTREIYIDGMLVAKTTLTASQADIDAQPTNFKVGSNGNGFKGYLDNLIIVSRALNKTEVSSLLNQGLVAPTPAIDTPLVLNSPSIQQLAGNNLLVGSLEGNGTINNAPSTAVTLTTGFSNLIDSSKNFTGSITGNNVTLVKLGKGFQSLAAATKTLTVQGETLVQGGTLWMDGGTLNTSAVKVSNGYTFGKVPPEFGGKGTINGNVIYMAGSIPVFTNTGTLNITGTLTVANGSTVRLRLGNNVGVGNYTLATYTQAGSSGNFHIVPEVESGSFASNAKGLLTQSNGMLVLNVTSIPSNTTISNLNVYPAVPGLARSTNYAVRIRRSDQTSTWNTAFVLQTRARPKESPSGYYDQVKDWSHSYVNFEMSTPVVVEIKKLDGSSFTNNAAGSVIVRPSAKGTHSFSTDGKTLTVNLSNPCNVSIDIDGQMEGNPNAPGKNPIRHTLSLHANATITDKPNPNAADVLTVTPGVIPPTTGPWKTLYFLPGIHDLGKDFQIYGNKQYYIPGDAIVHATLNNVGAGNSQNGSNIRIFGHGTISSERFNHWTLEVATEDLANKWRSLDIANCKNTKVEGITFADSAFHTIIMQAYYAYDPNITNTVSWVKVFTWRVNGDGGGCSAQSDVSNCFIRTQDDGLYLSGRSVRDTVMWTDVNGANMRLSFLTDNTVDPLTAENIDVIYTRSAWWSGSTGLQMPSDATGVHGAGVVFKNINFSDPFPSNRAIDITQGAGSFAGVRFENITIANPNHSKWVTNENPNPDKKNFLKALGDGSIQNLQFYNLKIGGTTVTSTNYTDYFTLSGNVSIPSFTDSSSSLPKVSVTVTDASIGEPHNHGMLTFNRVGNTTSALTINYTVAGRATDGVDFQSLGTSVTFPVGQTNVTKAITVTPDELSESIETMVLTILPSSNYVIASPNRAFARIEDSTSLSGALSRFGWEASSSNVWGAMANALDNDSTTRWDTGAAQSAGQWFQIDMGSVQSFNRIVLDAGTSSGDYPRLCQVLVSNDGITWGSPIAIGYGSTGPLNMTFPTQDARYIKLEQLENTSFEYWSIHDLKVFSPLLPSAGWVATASQNSGNAKNSIDGNIATRWDTGAAQISGQWFQVDMISNRTFNKLVIDSGTSTGDFPRGYDVLVSNTGADWTTAVPITSGVGTTQLITINFASQNARFIRVKQTGSTTFNWWSMHDFHVYAPTDSGLGSAWQMQDIGSVGRAGSFSLSNNLWTVGGSGADMWLQADQCRYVYQSSSDDCSVVARVASMVNTGAWARSGVMIRESTAANSIYAMLCVTPANGLSFQWRDATNGFTQIIRVYSQTVPKWIKITRVGNVFEAAYSDDNLTWTSMGTQTLTMATGATIGLVVSSNDNTKLCGSALEFVTATP